MLRARRVATPLLITVLLLLLCVSAVSGGAADEYGVDALASPAFEPVRCGELRNPALCEEVASLRAVNLGNALEAPVEGQWGVVLESRDFELIKAAKFNAVRVPVRWSAHASADEPYAVSGRFFDRIDWVLEESRRNGLLAIVNMHHYDELFDDPEAHYDRFVSIWAQIAERYQDISTDELWFELLNEPHGQLFGGRWNGLMNRTIEIVRESNPVRPIVIGGSNWNAYDTMSQLDLPARDTNLVLTFHYYEPFAFTHQGASWVGQEMRTGVDWNGSIWATEEIDVHFYQARNQARAHGLPLLLGEFGAYSPAPMDARVRWTHYVRSVAEANGMGWAYWEFRAGFGVYESGRGAWNDGLLTSLIPDR